MRDWKNEVLKIRENVILEEICGEYVLFAIKEAGEHCRYMQTLNETAGYFWKMLEEGLLFSKMVSKASGDFGISEDIIEADLINLLNQFDEMNYLL